MNYPTFGVPTQVIQSKKPPVGGTDQIYSRFIIPEGMKPGDKALAIPLFEVTCHKPSAFNSKLCYTINKNVINGQSLAFDVMA